MKDLKDRIIEKMQAGGTISYRSAYQSTEPKANFAPHMMGGQAPPRGVMGSSGGSKKSGSSEESGDSDYYNSTRKELNAITAQYQEASLALDSNQSIQPEDKARMQADLLLKYKEDMTDKRYKGTQLKEALVEFDKNSGRTQEISSEYIINTDASGSKAEVLVGGIDKNGKATGSYGFMDPYDVARSQDKVQPIKVSEAMSLAKNDPAFMSFVDGPRGFDLPSKLAGIVTHAELQKSAVDYFKTNTITTSEDGTEFTIGDETFNSAAVKAQGKRGEFNDITKKYNSTLTAAERGRYIVEAGLGKRMSPAAYMNDFLMGVADIDIDTEKVKETAQNYSAYMTSLTGSPTDVEEVVYANPPPPVDLADNDKEWTDHTRGVVNTNKKITHLPAGAYALDENYADNPNNSILIHKSKLLSSSSRTGKVYDSMNMLTTGENMKDMMANQMDLPNQDVMATLDKVHVRVDRGVDITYGVGFEGGNGKSSRELERMFMATNLLMMGFNATQGGARSTGLVEQWLKSDGAATEEKWMKKNRNLLNKMTTSDGKPLTDAQKKEYTRQQVATQNQKFLKKKFQEEVVEGDYFERYFKAKEGLSDEDAKKKSEKYKGYLSGGKFVVVPQMMVTVDIPMMTGNVEDAFEELQPYIGGEMHEMTYEEIAANKFDNAEVKSYFQTKILIDINTSELGLIVAGGKNQTVAGEAGKLTEKQSEEIKKLYIEPQETNNLNLYTEPVWDLLK